MQDGPFCSLSSQGHTTPATMLTRVLPVAARAAFVPLAATSSVTAQAMVPRTASLPFRLNVASVPDAFAHARVMEEPVSSNSIVMELLNRNARRPKKANHGKRPCSHFRRRQKRLSQRKNAN